ncbi:Uncharacterized protein APZ42_004869 [Daphnia magna]|uniref:Uncharacterized protein n=1 Tax=Daphnia magna TaxID=35525 RepID=A0A164GSQ4_9CRUS|nr:Uncharacterized protein APZ42_004869 [Daphnia magna]
MHTSPPSDIEPVCPVVLETSVKRSTVAFPDVLGMSLDEYTIPCCGP